MDENARKRKREEEGEPSGMEDITTEGPKEGLKRPEGRHKKQQQSTKPDSNQTEQKVDLNDATIAIAKAEKRREKRKVKQERVKTKKAKLAEKQKRRAQKGKEGKEEDAQVVEEGLSNSEEENEEVGDIDVAGLGDIEEGEAKPEESSASPSKDPSPFDYTQNLSGTSSISSLPTQNTAVAEKPTEKPAEESAEKPAEKSAKRPKLEVKIDQEELRARLQKRIAELRAARKADNPDGTPARTRSELIEMRRKKAEEKKKNKKALRQQAKEEERRQKEEALARGSPLLSPSGASPAGAHGQSPLSDPANNFSFGRIAFDNGQSMTANLDSVLDPHKSKGPQDPFTALQAAKKKSARLNGLDAEKRADIEEKDMWLNARKRAQGERPRDDTSLLKQTLKRKEKQKKKSEKEWNERIAGVAHGQASRQKKREDNLVKRKESRGAKGKGSKKAGGPKKGKSKARPGFEGSFKAGR